MLSNSQQFLANCNTFCLFGQMHEPLLLHHFSALFQSYVMIVAYFRATVSRLKSSIEVVEWNGNITPPSFKFHLNSVANLVVTQNDNQTKEQEKT